MQKVFIWHHKTWQVHTANYYPPMVPWTPQITCMDHLRARKKQPAEADQL